MLCMNSYLKFGAQVKAGDVHSGMEAHLWLEKTAFFKVPRALQDETVEQLRRPFEEVSDALFDRLWLAITVRHVTEESCRRIN